MPIPPPTPKGRTVQTLTLPKPVSQNALNAGALKGRIGAKTGWKMVVRAAARAQRLRPVRSYPVEIEAVAYFGPGETMMDADNLAGAVKATTDALRHPDLRVLRGDGPRDVRRVILGPCERTAGESRLEYRITETT